jgi:hypothetical protein
VLARVGGVARAAAVAQKEVRVEFAEGKPAISAVTPGVAGLAYWSLR